VFAHAPVIVPAVLRIQLPYNRGFYAQLTLLHVSLAVRLIGGDLLGNTALWQWGGVGNEAAILLFLITTALAVSGTRRRARRANQRRMEGDHTPRAGNARLITLRGRPFATAPVIPPSSIRPAAR